MSDALALCSFWPVKHYTDSSIAAKRKISLLDMRCLQNVFSEANYRSNDSHRESPVASNIANDQL